MSSLANAAGTPIFVAYVLAFGGAALICFVSVGRTKQITDPDTRRGLVALLATSGCWAAAHVAYLVVPSPQLKHLFYVVGLIVGISTVGPWLYFCSAYTGRSLHRSPAIRRLAVAVFLGIVTIKLTNPLHQLYYQAEFVTTPFAHLAVTNQLLHWLTMAFAYALATVGYFMLLELFWQVGHETRPLVVLVALTGLPALLDVVGLVSPLFLDITYAPLGVAPFAVGVLFLYLDEFQAIRLTGDRDDPVIILDDDDRVRDFNADAHSLVPELETGADIAEIFPELATSLDSDQTVIEMDRIGGMRFFQLSMAPFSTDQSRLGQVITLTDITDREQYRAELERQNDRLEAFAHTVSHDLRNPLDVAKNRLTLVAQEHDSEHLDAVAEAHDRMENLIEDVLALARQGQPIDATETVQLSTIVTQCWELVETADGSLLIERDLAIEADADRLQQLLENLFRNSIDHGGEDVTIRVGAIRHEAGFYVADDGPGIPPADREQAFESGFTTAADGTGFGLSIVKEIVDAHGWSIDLTESTDGGVRFEITGVDSVE